MKSNWYRLSGFGKDASISNEIGVVTSLPKISRTASGIDPNMVLVDMNQRRTRSLPKTNLNEISKSLHAINLKRWDYIPLEEMFKVLEGHGVIPLQEDGTRWSGWLMGEKECGAPGSEDQRCIFRLAYRQPDGEWSLSSSTLTVTWCTLWRPEGSTEKPRYEIVSYVW